MKSIIIDEISELIINHETKLNNSSKIEILLANKIIKELVVNYPMVMTPIVNCDSKIKVDVTLMQDDYYKAYKQNIIDKNYISVPRLEYCKTNSDKKYIELTYLTLNEYKQKKKDNKI